MTDDKLSNDDLRAKLPDFKKELELFASESFTEYEEKLNKVTAKAMNALETIIDDGTLALDPEQLVNSVKVLTKAKTDIYEVRRKLFETVVKGEVMMKALEPAEKKDKGSSVLEDYFKKTAIDVKASSSVFAQINDENRREEGAL